MKNIWILLVLFASCASPKIVSHERSVRDTVIYRTVEKEIQVPAFTAVSNGINIDSLAQLLKSGASREVIQRTLIREDPETRTRVGILIDSLGNLMAVCEQQERMIKVMLEEREILRTDFERIILREKQNAFEKLWGTLKALGIIVLIVIVAGVAVKFLR